MKQFQSIIPIAGLCFLSACAPPAPAPAPIALTSTPFVPTLAANLSRPGETRAAETRAAEALPTITLKVAATTAPVLPAPTVTPPPPNSAYPLLTVHLQAIQVSDDDGKRTARITAQEVKQWVDKANEIFANASVRFLYDPNLDFATLNSTLLNDMTGDTDPNWARAVDQGNRVAASHAGKLVVFFRFGPGQRPTGEGFSWSDYNFVAMPGFNDTTVCGYQNSGILAHEIGHYFGLAHPFTKTFKSTQEAESYLVGHANNPNIFDGDGLSDTPPDPFIDAPEFQCDSSIQAVTLNSRKFPLPRLNIMSYYSNPGVDRTELTPQQDALVRSNLGLRMKNGMATPTNRDVPGGIEFATLPIKNRTDIDAGPQDMTTFSKFLWSGNKQLFCSAQSNGSIGFGISVGATGKYRLDLYATMAPDFGKIQTLVDGNPLGAPIDLHAPLVSPTGKISIGTIDISAGAHTLGFRVAGKNAASSGYSFGLNVFALTRE